MGDGITVRGGSNGIDARCEDMISVAGLFGRAANDTAAVSWSLQRYLFDPGTFGSAVLDPVGAARYEFDLGAALDGPHGVSRLAVECAAMAVRLKAAAEAYRTADHLDAAAHTLLDGLIELPAAAVAAQGALVATGSPAQALQRLVTGDPGLADEAAALGMVAAAAGPPLARRALLSDGHATVQPLSPEAGETAHPPRSVTDLIEGLAARNRGHPGEVDVRILYRPDGTRAVVVDIPGTKSWTPLPTADVTSVVTDVRAMTGHDTSYERGVLAAMHQAGVMPDDDVLMIGHSEGGMVAVQAAVTATRTSSFHVTHVVTAGSPIGRIAGHVPPSVAVLALENAHDVVPHLDASANPPARNVTTVTFNHGNGAVLDNHDIESSYLPGAKDVDGSSDRSVRDFVASAGRFFDAEEVSVRRFLITRAY